MRKTWFTKALVALMTLAMVAGVFVTAPKIALATAASLAPSGGSTSSTTGTQLTLNATYTPGTSPDPEVPLSECTFDWAPSAGLSVVGHSGPGAPPWASVVSSTPGTYTLTVTAKKDGSPITGATYTYSNIVFTRPAISASISASPNATLSAGDTVTFTASPSGTNYTYAWDTATDGLTYTSGGSSNTITFTAQKTNGNATNTTSAGCKVSWSDAPTVNSEADYSYTVKAATLSASSGSLAIGNSVDINSLVQYKGNRTVTCSLAAGSADYLTLSGTGNTIVTAKKAGTAAVTVSYEGQTSTESYSINIPYLTPSLSFGTNSSTNPQKFKSGGSLNVASMLSTNVPAADISWNITSGTGTLSGSTYTAPSTAPSSAVVTASVSGGNYTSASANFYITVVGDYTISSVPTGTQRLTNVNDTLTFTPTVTAGGGTITASSSNESVATVSGNGTTFTVLGRSVGTATIYVSATNSSDSKSFIVVVGNPVPSIDRANTHYSSNSSGYTDRLNKSYPWLGLHIQVNNPAGGYYYAEVTRSNIRTYVPSNYYSSHPSTYVYRVALNANGFGESRIHAQYNGTTYYTIRVRDANGNVVDTYQLGNITVSGYTTMPQTGPDYTWVYVLGGLCVAALAAAVTLNARKKKQQEN